MGICTGTQRRSDVSEDTFYSSAYGLSLAANRPIPGICAQPARQIADTHIEFGVAPPLSVAHEPTDPAWYISDEREGNVPALRVWRAANASSYTMVYGDDTTFVVDGTGTHIWTTWAPHSTLADTAVYLLGPVLGFVLRLRGLSCLHASAVAIDGGAVVLLGPAGAGKSTTAAAFNTLGYALLTEDVVALEPAKTGFHVLPGYPQVRLWPDSVALLFGSEEALPRLTPTWDKRALDRTRSQLRFESRSLPVRAIYVLSGTSGRTGAATISPGIAALEGAEALLALLANTYVGYLLEPSARPREFEVLSQLASAVPLRQVRSSPAWRLPVHDLCGMILSDVEQL
jgi:hypothetical protein